LFYRLVNSQYMYLSDIPSLLHFFQKLACKYFHKPIPLLLVPAPHIYHYICNYINYLPGCGYVEHLKDL